MDQKPEAAMRREVDAFCLFAGAILAALAVAFGAFAAHGLKTMLGAEQFGWWQTGVQYQMWHALGLLALAGIPGARRSALLLASGTTIFSGSLYLMALTDARWLGMVTPIGGLLMIAGWLLLAWRGLRGRRAD
jgi:uncharacterized membrane protein YgdD (TMEM256/DUF423 family)